MSQIIANILFVLIPLYFVLSKKSSKRIKKIAGVVVVIVILGLVGELSAKLSQKHYTPNNTGTTATAPQTIQASAPVPSSVTQQIDAQYGANVYLPKVVPQGFIYTSWNITQPSATVYSPILSVTFGNNGTLLIWKEFDSRDSVDNGGDCSQNQYYTSSTQIGNLTYYYAQGNHGNDVWTCFTTSTDSNGIGIDIYFANTTVTPSPSSIENMLADSINQGS